MYENWERGTAPDLLKIWMKNGLLYDKLYMKKQIAVCHPDLSKHLGEILRCFSYTKIYSDMGRKETGLNCRNGNELGQ
jgi:hypothetical protein